MIRPRRPGLAALGLLAAAACASVDWTPEPEPPFAASPLGADRFRVEVNLPDVAPAPGSMLVLCACARLAVDHRRDYFRIEERRALERGRGAFTLVLEEVPPPGAPVLELDAPARDTTDRAVEDARFDARAALATCARLGLDAHRTER